MSPVEQWTGKEPTIGHLRVLESRAWVHIPQERRQKLHSKAVKCIMVGYEEDTGSQVYQLYDRVSKKLILSRDVIVDNSHTGSSPESVQASIRLELQE